MPFRPPIHQPHDGAAVRRKAHDQWRGSAASRGYDAAWRVLRRAKLAADPLCWWCLHEGILTPANTVDHIVPIVERPELRLVWGNLRSGCKPCHDAHTARETAAGHRGMRGKPGTGSRAGV
jgi:5-methylcytosine-specific restriction protein A